jgi:NADP-dependent 3-hydroxy acid dehydrogenase YdfG
MPRFAPHPQRRPAIVAGASSGIGAAAARALAGAGHPVVLGARRVERCEAAADEIRRDGGEAWAIRLDVGDGASIKDFVLAAQEAAGDIEVLVCNAGDPALGRGIDIAPDDFAHQVSVNLLGAQQLVSLLAPAMVERGRGDLVFVTSDGVVMPRPGMAAYMTAKWGLEGYARVLQIELEGTGVRACVVRPGPTASEMGSSWEPDAVPAVLEEWGKWGLARHDSFLRPAQVASVIAHAVAMPRGSQIALVEVQPEAPGPNDLQGGGTT